MTEWRDGGVTQAFLVHDGRTVFGCEVHDLDCTSTGKGSALTYMMEGVHHVILVSPEIGT